MSQRIKQIEDQMPDEEAIEERSESEGKKKNQEMMKMMSRQKKEMVIPQES